MSARARPWDRKRKVPLHLLNNDKDTTTVSDYIEINGTKYYSDRFYLNEGRTSSAASATMQGCTCGASQPPPLFCRSQLVASLDLTAAIIGTYTIDVRSMISEFPSLFTGDVPCLVMQGKKSWTIEEWSENERKQRENDPESDVDSILGEDDEDDTLQTAKQSIPPNVHFSEITSTWLPQLPSSLREVICPESGCLHDSVIDQRVYKRGVHHPKFMILFETNGSVVVVISTANFTQPGYSIDGSWVQRFPPSSTTTTTSTTASFGLDLANFLQCQTLSTAAKQLTAYGFVRRYLGWKSLKELALQFDFSTAVVSLVATVPGDYDCDSTDYGMQRMAHLVETMPWALKDAKRDRLILQPTSFGSEWKDKNLVDLARSYLETKNEKSVLQRLEIFWPTQYFVQRVRTMGAAHTGHDEELTFSPGGKSDSPLSSELQDGGFLFLSSDAFNRIGVDCLSRMFMYEPSSQQKKVLVPHFKSLVRVFQGSDYKIRKEYGLPKCQEYFSWFVLTSACLSRGAQGERHEGGFVSYMNFELGVMFTTRMGGTRCSNNRLYCYQPSTCACKRQHHSKGVTHAQLIHLPCPYLFHPPSYVENAAEEVVFRETPYFHEILEGTGNMGNMKLTPLGKALADQYR